jgi:hypothetical protein
MEDEDKSDRKGSGESQDDDKKIDDQANKNDIYTLVFCEISKSF